MERLTEILNRLPITKGVDLQVLEKAMNISRPQMCEYAKGDVILLPGQMTHRLFVLCKGRAAAYSADEHHTFLLRDFKPYEIFGLSNLFTEMPFATKISALTKCNVLILDKDFLSYLIDHDKAVRYQYISTLAEKTLYLNKKIACLTAGSAEQRLAYWLDAKASENTVDLDIPMSSLCTMLDMGRASLYRAFDRLENDGFIKRNGKTVYLLNRENMISFYQ